MFGFFKGSRRKKLLGQELPGEWRGYLERNVAVYRLLPAADQRKLIDAARIIASERPFVGCQGLVVTEEMKVTIAAQASLLLLGHEGYYFDRVTSFLIYPYKMLLPPRGVRPSDESEFSERVILGQAIQFGEIILSWPDVLSGGRVADDGENVVLHELAHHLDGLDGEMGGSPPGLARQRQDHFHLVIETALAQLRRNLAEGRNSVLSAPAAESTTELFAWSTECFYERPAALAQQYPELFDCLREFYKVDPSEWFAHESQVEHEHEHEGEDEDEDEETAAVATELPPLETADQYFARGCEHFDLGRYDLAAADFNACVRLDPQDQEAVLWRGRAYFFEEHVDAALADADRACRLQPSDGEAICLRAMCLTAVGRFDEALREFDRAGDEPHGDIHAVFYRGVARAERGLLDAAVSDFSSVIASDPQDAEAWYERAMCFEQLGRLEEARCDLRRARELGWEEDGEMERRRDREK